MQKEIKQNNIKNRTKIKLCGLSRMCDIEYANTLMPEYIGFVFAPKSKRYVTPENAEILQKQLDKRIISTGVFVNERIEKIIDLLKRQIIQAVQLHGDEDEKYIHALKQQTKCMIIKAFQIKNREDMEAANRSFADYVLLDSGKGSGECFDWALLKEMRRSYFLAGGLTSQNVAMAIDRFSPYGVDASSSLETDGYKDKAKMTAFVQAVREREV